MPEHSTPGPGAESTRRATVIGAGAVGMCCACFLQRAGFQVTVVDRLDPGMGASYGNAGGIAVSSVIPVSTPGLLRTAPGWLLDPKGPLTVRWRYLPTLAPWLVKFLRAGSARRVAGISTALAALLQHTYADLDTLLQAAGIADMLDRGGALYLYDRESELERERWEWDRRAELGMVVERVDGHALPDLEPDIAADFACAMFAKDWSRLSDPYRFVTVLAAHFARHGGVIRRTEVTGLQRDGQIVTTIQLADGTSSPIDRLVVAAGAWSARLAAQLGERVPLESERGYHTTLPDPRIGVNHEIVYATQGFVITPLDPRVAGRRHRRACWSGRACRLPARPDPAAQGQACIPGAQYRRRQRMDGAPPGAARFPAGDRPIARAHRTSTMHSDTDTSV